MERTSLRGAGQPHPNRPPTDSHALRFTVLHVDDIYVRNDTLNALGFTMTDAEIDQFWSRVHIPEDRSDANHCWLYDPDAVGDRGRSGHVRVRVAGGHRVFVHRLAFVLTGGVFTEELDIVIHSCDVPSCCAPAHLRAGDRLANARDRDLRGRRSPFLPRGEESPSAKLTTREVDAMRRARDLGVPARTLALSFDVSLATVYARTDPRDLSGEGRKPARATARGNATGPPQAQPRRSTSDRPRATAVEVA